MILSAEGRTGSTLLHSALRQHPKIHVVNEAFCHTGASRYNYAYRPYRNQSGAEFLETLRSKAKTESQAFGFKLFSRHVINSAAALNPEAETVWEGLREQGWKIVWLFRRNLFEQVCSLGAAIESGIWQRWRSGGVTRGRATAQPEEFDGLEHTGAWFEDRMQRIDRSNSELRERLRSCDSTTIYYEDLNERFTETLFHVQDFLGVERRPAEQLTMKLSRDSRKLVKNYDEVRAYFEGTAYERFFQARSIQSPADLPSP